ncbi:hypothetical protein A6V39_00655 [Candidatus Mycoplasma haematobovis]|uniref:Uncharacterized protein n=1 Tax=Candidatus Mycoplasma haematobovis TaxID=432608 RepID=A0A1A9QEX7_9MOLU|nr:hypothetical protein [Candidatus Mycoplasma haematobovis]OAL10561.1 hypothetical protein A6V39_00655 [Candidatus Mycoplasma haematobovis]
MTAVGTCSTISFNLDKANSIGKALEPIKNTYIFNLFSKGIFNLNNTFKDWGGSIFNSKDAFIDWLNRYFDVNGFKAGVVALYEKLHNWAGIVYRWFRDKFLEFVGNIPKIVENWKQIRLSLFKWGTFLGGGGGSALWSMLGVGANWSKLGDLMGHPDFMEMMNDFNQLVQDNEEAFKEMGPEDVEDILQKYLDNPEEAKQAAKDLLQEQKERKEKEEKDKENKSQEEKKDEEKQEKSKELSVEEIKEKFNPSQAGQPPTVPAVFSNMVTEGLKKLQSLSYFSFGGSNLEIESKAKEGMEKYLESLKNDVEKEKAKRSRKPSVKSEFLDIIAQEKEALVNALATAAVKAYRSSESLKIEALTQKFIEALTIPCEGGKDCDADELVKALSNEKK